MKVLFRVLLIMVLIASLLMLSLNVNAINNGIEEMSSTEVIYDVDKPVIEVDFDREPIMKDNVYFFKTSTIMTLRIYDFTSKLSNVTYKINDQIIDCDMTGEKIGDNLNEMSEEYCFHIGEEQGIFKINISAADTVGNKTDKFLDINIDNDIPVIEGVQIVDKNNNIINPIVDNGIAAKSDVYGYFIDDTSIIKIKVSDGENGIGVNDIYYYLEDLNGERTPEKTSKVNDSGEAIIRCDKGFKGHIYARAGDLLGNLGEYVTFCGIVVGEKEKGVEAIEISLTPEKTDMLDEEGLRLYNDDVNVYVEVKNAFSGVKSIKWEIEGDNNRNKTITVDSYGNPDDSTFNRINMEKNLLTKTGSIICVENDSNNIELKVTVEDWFNNISEKRISFSIDKTNPEIEIEYDGEIGKYNRRDIIATVKVRDENFNPANFKLNLQSNKIDIPKLSTWTRVPDEKNPGKDLYMSQLFFDKDGEYSLGASCIDKAGNKSVQVNSESFIIDKTAPKVTVEFDETDGHNSKYFNNIRRGKIIVEEEYFEEELVSVWGIEKENITDWVSADGKNVAQIVFEKEGSYYFEVEATDKSGNISDKISIDEFVIDTTAPEIVISQVEDKSGNKGVVAPIIEYKDANLNTSKCSYELVGALNGRVNINSEVSEEAGIYKVTFDNFAGNREMDDIYTLKVIGEDMAKNVREKTIEFSVNRFGSTYYINDELKSIDGKYVKLPVDVVLREVNADAIDEDSIEIIMSFNGNQRNLVNGTDYVINEKRNENRWHEYEYIIDKGLFNKDGKYSLILYSKDRAGNENDNISEEKKAQISFGVDSTGPNVKALNLENNCVINEKMYEGMIIVNDNLVLESVEIKLNDEEVEAKIEDNKYIFNIPESESYQSVKVLAYDAAGNETIETIDNIKVLAKESADNTYYVYVIILAVVGIIFFIGNKIKRR